MKTVIARVLSGDTFRTARVDIYTIDEAKKILDGKDWRIGEDIFDPEDHKRIGWRAEWDYDGIYVEVSKRRIL